MTIKTLLNKKNISLQVFLGLALGSEFAYLVIASIENLRLHIPIYLLCYGVAFILYWIAAVYFFGLRMTSAYDRKKERPTLKGDRGRFLWLDNFVAKQKTQEKLSSKEIVTIGIVWGVIFRLTLLFTTPTLSDDIYRYVWDGKVATHGINPYQHAPDTEQLSSLRDTEIYPLINHKEISTIYPPISQIIFAGLFKLNPSVLGFKTGFLIFELLTIAGLFLILKFLRMNPNRLLIYVWNPLIIVEFSGSGHADVFGILFLTVALFLIIQRKLIWSNFLIVLSFLTKFIAILFLPIITLIKKNNKAIIPLLFVLFVAIFYLPYADAGQQLFSGLLVYSDKWQFNSSVFSLILSAVKSLLSQNWIINLIIEPAGLTQSPVTVATKETDLALMISKGIIAFIFAIVFAYFLTRLKRDLEKEGNIWFFKLGLILLGTVIILNPTVHPWYLCWLMPFLVVAPNRAWILLTGLVGLSYWVLIDYTEAGIWRESLLVKYLEYLPFYLLLIFDRLKNAQFKI